MTPIVIHGDQRTGKTFNQDAFAKHYGAKVGGEIYGEPRNGRMKLGHLYTSLTPVGGAQNIHISKAFEDAGITPFNRAQ